MQSERNDQPGWERLAAAFITAREASGYAKRAKLATRVGVNDSTLQIIEGKKAGAISEQMLNTVTMQLGWKPGQWRTYLDQDAPLSTGDLIAAVRRTRNWSEFELAEEIGVAAEMVKEWEAGADVPREVLGAIEKLFAPPSVPDRPATRRRRSG